MKHNSSLSFVSLNPDSTTAAMVNDLFRSWQSKKFLGFNWTPDKVLEELRNVSNLAFVENELGVLILFKEIPPDAEIFLVFKNKRQDSEAVKRTLEFLFNANGHITTWWLEVHEQNLGAKSLYEGVGFELQSTRKNYYSDGGNALIYCQRRR